MRATEFIGFAGRRAANFRFANDRQDYSLMFSAELADDLLALLNRHAAPLPSGDIPCPATLIELRDVLQAIKDEDLVQ